MGTSTNKAGLSAIGREKEEKFEYIGKLCADQHDKIKVVQFSPAERSVELCFALTDINTVNAW